MDATQVDPRAILCASQRAAAAVPSSPHLHPHARRARERGECLHAGVGLRPPTTRLANMHACMRLAASRYAYTSLAGCCVPRAGANAAGVWSLAVGPRVRGTAAAAHMVSA